MNFYVMTLFPEMITSGLGFSVIGKAIEKGLIDVNAVNIRDFAGNKHMKVDDYPYGGGAGMVMQAPPIVDCHRHIIDIINTKKPGVYDSSKKPRVIYLTPQGRVFNQSIAEELSKEEDLIFLCGHYEGVDERALDLVVTDNISIGDFVLTGGEMPAMIMIDAISRLLENVLHNDVSAEFESFNDNLLEYPQYTRPVEYEGLRVPDVLMSGHHANIEKWRRKQSIRRTLERRPDLLKKADLTEKEKKEFDIKK